MRSLGKRHFLRAKQGLVIGKQHLIELEDIVFSADDKIFHDHVKLAGVGQGITCSRQQFLRLGKGQLQGDGKGQNGGLFGV